MRSAIPMRFTTCLTRLASPCRCTCTTSPRWSLRRRLWCLLERLEAQPLERRRLRVADARLDLALPIRIADAARQRHDAVMRQDVAVEGIERRVVDIGRQHALA